MKAPPLGPGGEDITWPDQVAPRGRRTSSTRNVKCQTSNLKSLPYRYSSKATLSSIVTAGQSRYKMTGSSS